MRHVGFFRTVLAGLAAGAILAVAGGHAWVDYTVRPSGLSLIGSDLGTMPLAAALSYLLLASWGVLLVTRKVVRRAFALITLAASVGLVACLVYAAARLPQDIEDRFTQPGITVSTHLSGWYWTAVIAVLVSLAASALAARRVGTWPEMGTRYDAPGARPAPVIDPDDPDAGSREMWRALDAGQDPTDPTHPDTTSGDPAP